jgi:hypothetical protein
LVWSAHFGAGNDTYGLIVPAQTVGHPRVRKGPASGSSFFREALKRHQGSDPLLGCLAEVLTKQSAIDVSLIPFDDCVQADGRCAHGLNMRPSREA